MEEFVLDAYFPEHITEILKNGEQQHLGGECGELKNYTIELLPKLRLHGENVMKKLDLYTHIPQNITEILKEENNSIWIGEVKTLELGGYAVEILPKLRLHEENVMDEFILRACRPGYFTETLKKENKSIWIGKVKEVRLEGLAKEIENKLDFTLIEPDDQE
ncbi:MAG: uncharacterized protein A8A55_2803 [Amphiamblys sp. WSBS2006]|nr:MAG: uncharacterized protein A8A55_2803 [Amphiamblys sp. WSBS2006]